MTVEQLEIGSTESASLSLGEHLASVDWDIETYPIDLLALTDEEIELVSQFDQGESIRGIAANSTTPHSVLSARHTVARGKQEAHEALINGLSVSELSPYGQRVVLLNDLFGKTWNRGNSVVINTDASVVYGNAKALDELLGGKWRRCPQLSVMDIGTLQERILRYDSILKPTWRNTPALLTQSPEVIEERATQYNEWFGEDWQLKPVILTNRPSTVISSARALKSVGITRDNTPPGPYYGLLGTSVANKKKKAEFIRREILGHTEVRISTEPRPLAEVVEERRQQAPEQRDAEESEIRELEVFLRHLGAQGLTQSVTVIKSWAQKNGYQKQRTQ